VARDYADQRQAFGRAIHEFQAVGFKIADMVTRIEAARLLTLRAAWLKDAGFRVTREAAMAKLFASESASAVTHDAVQVLGGYGYTKDFPVERYLRGARVTGSYEGSGEVQRMVIHGQVYRELDR